MKDIKERDFHILKQQNPAIKLRDHLKRIHSFDNKQNQIKTMSPICFTKRQEQNTSGTKKFVQANRELIEIIPLI